jgi:heterodisulfide reductase subunit A
MPASSEEIEALLREGIEIEFLSAPVRLYGTGGRIEGLECIRVRLGEPDGSGRRRPVPIASSEFSVAADTAITALGQAVDSSFVAGTGMRLGPEGTVDVDPSSGATNVRGVFSGGDVVTGPASVIDAIAAGKTAARSIDAYLKEEAPAASEKRRPQDLSQGEVAALAQKVGRSERIRAAEEPVESRVTDFREVSLGYRAEEAMREASRCLAGAIEGCIECGECEKRCDVKAVDHRMRNETIQMEFDSIVLAPGFDLYDPTEKSEYGYGRLDGVLTGIEFERLCSVTGPTGGEIVWNGRSLRRFFFIQCVGSRDRQSGARFCSRVCCMYTAKHASILTERITDARIYVSYIDVRAYGKGYEEFYKSTQEGGVLYIKGIPGEIVQGKGGLLVRVEDMLSGELREIEVDLVILATGVRPRKRTQDLCKSMSVATDDYGFIRVDGLAPSETNVDGIFVCGMASGPKDVPDTVASGGEAASRCLEYLVGSG